MSENIFVSTVESLFHGMDNFIHAGLVVGEAVNIGDTIILPLADVSFGCAAGAFEKGHSNTGAGGLGGKVSPCAILVIQNGFGIDFCPYGVQTHVPVDDYRIIRFCCFLIS